MSTVSHILGAAFLIIFLKQCTGDKWVRVRIHVPHHIHVVHNMYKGQYAYEFNQYGGNKGVNGHGGSLYDVRGRWKGFDYAGAGKKTHGNKLKSHNGLTEAIFPEDHADGSVGSGGYGYGHTGKEWYMKGDAKHASDIYILPRNPNISSGHKYNTGRHAVYRYGSSGKGNNGFEYIHGGTYGPDEHSSLIQSQRHNKPQVFIVSGKKGRILVYGGYGQNVYSGHGHKIHVHSPGYVGHKPKSNKHGPGGYEYHVHNHGIGGHGHYHYGVSTYGDELGKYRSYEYGHGGQSGIHYKNNGNNISPYVSNSGGPSNYGRGHELKNSHGRGHGIRLYGIHGHKYKVNKGLSGISGHGVHIHHGYRPRIVHSQGPILGYRHGVYRHTPNHNKIYGYRFKGYGKGVFKPGRNKGQGYFHKRFWTRRQMYIIRKGTNGPRRIYLYHYHSS